MKSNRILIIKSRSIPLSGWQGAYIELLESGKQTPKHEKPKTG